MDASQLRYLLLQVRKPDDPMRAQEVRCFSTALGCGIEQISVHDLIRAVPTAGQLQDVDVVLMGGSGDYSVVAGGDWLDPALTAICRLYELRKPTFASCWGFQAMAKAFGGSVVTDVARAELGTYEIHLTEAGLRDPVLGPLGSPFLALEGHQDIVTGLPKGARLLATSESGIFQSFMFPGTMIYCTQFHPELTLDSFLERVKQYPEYLEGLLGISMDEFLSRCEETPRATYFFRHYLQAVVEFLERTTF